MSKKEQDAYNYLKESFDKGLQYAESDTLYDILEKKAAQNTIYRLYKKGYLTREGYTMWPRGKRTFWRYSLVTDRSSP